jgi:tRNA pseudouridine55 synthase
VADLSGVVVVDKPSGPTSFDVVRRVKGLFKTKRCGHTGTLDPTATGVLPICIGDATKVASFISDGEKEYDAVVRFGETTDTQDAAGRTIATRPPASSSGAPRAPTCARWRTTSANGSAAARISRR